MYYFSWRKDTVNSVKVVREFGFVSLVKERV